MSQPLAQPENEFAGITATAGPDAPPVTRRWVNISTGGHLSGVSWGAGPAQVVLVAAPDGEARDLDPVALGLDAPSVVLDLPGTGRSSGPATTPRRAARAIAEAVASFAPRASLWVGIGSVAALAAAARAGRPPAAVLLVDPVVTEADWPLLTGPAAPVTLVRTEGSPAIASPPDVAITGIGELATALPEFLRRTPEILHRTRSAPATR